MEIDKEKKNTKSIKLVRMYSSRLMKVDGSQFNYFFIARLYTFSWANMAQP